MRIEDFWDSFEDHLIFSFELTLEKSLSVKFVYVSNSVLIGRILYFQASVIDALNLNIIECHTTSPKKPNILIFTL